MISCHSTFSLLIKPRGFYRFNSTFYSMKSGNSRARVSLLKAPYFIGHYTSRMNRVYNEDQYYAGVLSLPSGSSLVSPRQRAELGIGMNKKRTVFNFAMFDGHGGDQCSSFLKNSLAEYVENCDLRSGERLADNYKTEFAGYWRAWKKEVTRYGTNLTPFDDLQLRLPLAFLQADYDFSSKAHSYSGSTCTSVYLYSLDDTNGQSENVFWDPKSQSRLVVAHVGDTRCILVDRFGNYHPLTAEHHPSSPLEAARLQRYSSHFFTDSFGEERFEMFANTRSFGDSQAKSLGVSAEPELIECMLGNGWDSSSISLARSPKVFNGNEAALVIMSDGVSGLLADDVIADLVISTAVQQGYGRGTPQDAAEEIVKFVEETGGDDNASCMVIRLGSWGKWQWTDRTARVREGKLQDALDRPASRRSG